MENSTNGEQPRSGASGGTRDILTALAEGD